MASGGNDPLQDTTAALRQKLLDRRRAIGSLRSTGEFETGEPESLQDTMGSPMRLSQLQPRADARSDGAVMTLGTSASPVTDFAALREHLAPSRRQSAAALSRTAQEAATAAGAVATSQEEGVQMNDAMRDKLRAKVAGARLKKQQSLDGTITSRASALAAPDHMMDLPPAGSTTKHKWKKAVNFAGKDAAVKEEGNSDAAQEFFVSMSNSPPTDSELNWHKRKPGAGSVGSQIPQTTTPTPASTSQPQREVHLAMPPDSAAPEENEPLDELDTSALLDHDQLRTPRHGGTRNAFAGEEQRLLKAGRAVVGSYKVQTALEETLYFLPSTVDAPATDKVPTGTAPRFLEQEGIFTGRSMQTSHTNRAIAENRLLRQNGRESEWFGSDGRLLSLPDPLKPRPDRKPEWWLKNETLDSSTYFHPAQLDPDTRLSELQSKRWCLSFNIKTVKFSHHHLFSIEHVLASRLSQYYKAYTLRKEKANVAFLTDKLKALKLAAAQLQTTLSMGNQGDETAGKQLQDYCREIRRVRQLRDMESFTEKQLVQNMFSCWVQVKGQRQIQGFANTGLKLLLKKEAVNKDEDERKWQEEVDEEVSEIREEMEKRHQVELATYQQQKAAYKALRQQQQQTAGGSSEAVEDELQRPRKPAAFDEEACRAAVSERALQNKRRPGNPIITPTLETGLPLTVITDCPRDEQARRREVVRHFFFIRVLIDDREVAQSRSRMLEQDFSIRFDELVNTHPQRWPAGIRLQVVEDNHLQSRLLSEVHIGVPSHQLAVDSAEMQHLEFSSERRVNPAVLSAVGSGSVVVPPAKVDGVEEQLQRAGQEILTSACLGVSCGWNLDPVTKKPSAPPNFDEDGEAERNVHAGDAIAALGMAGVADARKLAAWLEEAKLDPNDPRNFDLLQSVQDFKARSSASVNSFRLSAVEKGTYFATDDEMNKDRRMRLILIRNEEQSRHTAGGRKVITVPASSLKVTAQQLEDAETHQEQPNMAIDGINNISLRRAQGRILLAEARKRVSERVQSMQTLMRKEHVINEDPLPDLGTFFVSVLKLLNPFSSASQNEERLAERGITSRISEGSVTIRVQILSANRLPQREDIAHSTRASGRGRSQRSPPPMLRPFVEVSFQRNTESTDVAEGTDPEWNESLALPLTCDNGDYTVAGLQAVEDLIYFNVFDEELVDLLQDERRRETNIHQRRHRHWLGTFCLPFQTLYARSQVSGTFQLQVPLVLLGYQLYQAEESILPLWLLRSGHRIDRPCLTINLVLEPKLASLPSIHLQFDSSEDRRLLRVCSQWETALHSKFPRREYRATVVNFRGSTVFITRYIAKQCPPAQVCPQAVNAMITIKHLERVAHFVAMIPFVSDTTTFAGMCDLWATSEEFLQVLSGDEEEHAVLLCNYFLYMKQQAWVVIGDAIPEGSTAYVLTWHAPGADQPEYQLWQPSTGKHFLPFDPLCALQAVYFLFNGSNIWANVQAESHPSRITFDLTNTSRWRPFFTASFPSPALPSVQIPQLTYETTPADFSNKLEVVLEQRLMTELMGWRERQVTRWNRYCSRALKELLPRFEANPYNVHVSSTSPNLSNLLKSYRLTGFPLHMAFTDVSAVVEALHSTGLHLNDDPAVEFALAVYAHVYANEIVSLWVYVASVYKR